MNDAFLPEEALYRAVYPPETAAMFWRKDGTVSSSAFADPKGLSVERGYYRPTAEVITSMKKHFKGNIIMLFSGDCFAVHAVVRYLPSKNNPYHSEIHGSEMELLLSKTQRLYLSRRAIIAA